MGGYRYNSDAYRNKQQHNQGYFQNFKKHFQDNHQSGYDYNPCAKIKQHFVVKHSENVEIAIFPQCHK